MARSWARICQLCQLNIKKIKMPMVHLGKTFSVINIKVTLVQLN